MMTRIHKTVNQSYEAMFYQSSRHQAFTRTPQKVIFVIVCQQVLLAKPRDEDKYQVKSRMSYSWRRMEDMR